MAAAQGPQVRNRTQIAVFRTLLASHAAVVEDVKRLLKQSCGLTMREFDMIAELGGQAELNMGDLGERMITSPSSVTRIAKGLEGKGLVTRRRSDHSEREVVAALTPKGEAFFQEHFRNVADGISAQMDARLAPEEQETLCALLAKLS